VSELSEKSVKPLCQVGNSNIAISSLPTLQISLVIVALFEMIYYEFRFLPSSQMSGRMYIVQYRYFNKVYDVKSVSQPDTMPILGYTYCLQIIETGFGEQF
jgi:hypothetical protein